MSEIPEGKLSWPYAKRAVQMAENLMLRQNPSEVSDGRAVAVVQASIKLYKELEERIVEEALEGDGDVAR